MLVNRVINGRSVGRGVPGLMSEAIDFEQVYIEMNERAARRKLGFESKPKQDDVGAWMCHRGHLVTKLTYWTDVRGYRRCKACRDATNARYREKLKGLKEAGGKS